MTSVVTDFHLGCASRMTNLFRSQAADGIVGLSPSSSSFLHAIMLAHQAENYHVR